MFYDVKNYKKTVSILISILAHAVTDDQGLRFFCANACMQRCNSHMTFDSTPFCGSDGFTYSTHRYLKCFRACNIPIEKVHDGPCNQAPSMDDDNKSTTLPSEPDHNNEIEMPTSSSEETDKTPPTSLTSPSGLTVTGDR